MCTRYSISERLKTSSLFHQMSVKFILFCMYSCVPLLSLSLSLSLCLPSSTFGTSALSPYLTFGTNTVATHTEINPIELHKWTQWHCRELIVNLCRIPIVSYTVELPALSVLLFFQLGYLGVLKNNLSFTGFSTQWAKNQRGGSVVGQRVLQQ